MKGGSAPFAACEWCSRVIREGEFSVQLVRRLIQPAWQGGSEAWRCTELRTDLVLTLCRECGLLFEPQDLREAGPEPGLGSEDGTGDDPFPGSARRPSASEGLEYAAYVRSLLRTAGEARLGKPRALRNAVIDYTAEYEGAPQHFGEYESVVGGDWIDPEYEAVGSCSRAAAVPLGGEGGGILRCRRDFSFVSIDWPNALPGDCGATYLGMLMRPLRYLSRTEDDLYGWLRVLFASCAGKPVAYFSRYQPGPTIVALADAKNVQLLSVPLDSVPLECRERNRCFHLPQTMPTE